MINTVKIQGENYLVNGSLSVPKAEGNRHYRMVQEWIEEGNTPEPEFTDVELADQKKAKDIAEAKQYLAESDWYYTRKQETGKEVPTEVYNKRIEMRELINELEG